MVKGEWYRKMLDASETACPAMFRNGQVVPQVVYSMEMVNREVHVLITEYRAW
jgi:hypothetical protein